MAAAWHQVVISISLLSRLAPIASAGSVSSFDDPDNYQVHRATRVHSEVFKHLDEPLNLNDKSSAYSDDPYLLNHVSYILKHHKHIYTNDEDVHHPQEKYTPKAPKNHQTLLSPRIVLKPVVKKVTQIEEDRQKFLATGLPSYNSNQFNFKPLNSDSSHQRINQDHIIPQNVVVPHGIYQHPQLQSQSPVLLPHFSENSVPTSNIHVISQPGHEHVPTIPEQQQQQQQQILASLIPQPEVIPIGVSPHHIVPLSSPEPLQILSNSAKPEPHLPLALYFNDGKILPQDVSGGRDPRVLLDPVNNFESNRRIVFLSPSPIDDGEGVELSQVFQNNLVSGITLVGAEDKLLLSSPVSPLYKNMIVPERVVQLVGSDRSQNELIRQSEEDERIGHPLHHLVLQDVASPT